MQNTQIKICGVTNIHAAECAINAGADFLGFVFYPPSPRHVGPKKAIELIRYVKSLSTTLRCVGLFVNPSDEELEEIVPYLDMIQLHGDEAPARCSIIKQRHQRPIMKAIAIKTKNDLAQIKLYEPVCDWLLFDAKPADINLDVDKTMVLPGGNGINFDWTLLQGQIFTRPWMLAGGLTAENVRTAIQLVSPSGVDVSSGVESGVGNKDCEKITSFINSAKENTS